MKENQNVKPFLARLRELEISGTIVEPLSNASYVQSACTRFGASWDKKFKTSTNRAERTITVTRTA